MQKADSKLMFKKLSRHDFYNILQVWIYFKQNIHSIKMQLLGYEALFNY